ncbi:MAG: hypothetical protein M1338_02615, partial [Patescibacteria group bacterium]|nr:hypothetical protein [Patescibacteria group bacterium]
FVIISIWRYIKYHSQDWFIILILFLGFFSLYSLYLGVNWSLGLIMLGALVLIFFTYYCYIKEHNIQSLVWALLISILGVEFFVALIVWPIDPKDKSLILIGSFYFFTEIIKLKESNQLNWKKTISLGILILLIILLIILTSNWYKQ